MHDRLLRAGRLCQREPGGGLLHVVGLKVDKPITVCRVAGELEYVIASRAAAAQTYVYEFEANYWSGLSNGVKVVVSPACTGTVEVVYE